MDSPCYMMLLLATCMPLVDGVEQEIRQGMFGVDQGKVLRRHVFEKRLMTSPIDCGRHCTASVQCLTFNYRRKGPDEVGVCELNNSTRRVSPGHYKTDSRYQHYYDLQTESIQFRSCLDYLRQGSRISGIYIIRDEHESYKVWCDLTSESGSAWTLIFSYALQNKDQPAFCSRSFGVNLPINQDSPNWKAYRMPLDKMKLVSGQSTHWRATTGFKDVGVDYTDYIRGKISDFDILSFEGPGICKRVELVNIRGHRGVDTTAQFWQLNGSYGLHMDSSITGCPFKANSGSLPGENNFGYYCENQYRINANFRGTKDGESTTEYWFGGYL